MSRTLAGWVALAAALVTPAAHADTVVPSENRLTVGLTSLSFGSFFRGTPSAYALEAGYGFLRPGGFPLELGGGLRASTGRAGVAVPLEVFGRARFIGQLGYWEPAVGPELGWSGLSALSPRRDGLPEDLDRVEAGRLSAVYFSFDAAPLRFRFGRFTASAFELSVGSTVWPLGSAVRTEFGLLHLGYVLW